MLEKEFVPFEWKTKSKETLIREMETKETTYAQEKKVYNDFVKK